MHVLSLRYAPPNHMLLQKLTHHAINFKTSTQWIHEGLVC